MNLDETQTELNRYFSDKLDAFGATPKGVDYNGPEAQAIRFEQLAKVINPDRHFSVIDYGSGYGAMLDFLNTKGWQFEYWGIDLIEKMVLAGRKTHETLSNAHFTTNEREAPVADYLLAGAIFNIKLGAAYDEWREFSVQTLHRMDALCSRGFAFNMLTKYSDADRIAQNPNLYYGDPLYYFDYCKRNFSRHVALLHDYGLYDFTILVRKTL
jgi:hypothetical protein